MKVKHDSTDLDSQSFTEKGCKMGNHPTFKVNGRVDGPREPKDLASSSSRVYLPSVLLVADAHVWRKLWAERKLLCVSPLLKLLHITTGSSAAGAVPGCSPIN